MTRRVTEQDRLLAERLMNAVLSRDVTKAAAVIADMREVGVSVAVVRAEREREEAQAARRRKRAVSSPPGEET